MSAHLAVGAAAVLAGLAALRGRQGSRSQPDRHRLNDLPDDMRDILLAGLYELGLNDGKAEDLAQTNPILPITMQPMHLLWPEVRRNFPGVDRQGVPADLWTEDHWDDRGPPHVMQLHKLLCLLLPTQEDRQNPARIRDRLLAGDAAPRWQRDPSAQIWEDADRDMWIVAGLRPRPAPTQADIGTVEGIFNLPPAIFVNGKFFDGRHRLFAARLAGLSHFPVVDVADLEGAASPSRSGSMERP